MSIFARNALLVLGAYHEGNPCGILLQYRQTVTVMPWNFRRLWNSLTLFGPPRPTLIETGHWSLRAQP